MNDRDQWGFNPLAYCVRSNFVTGFFFLITKGAKFDPKYTDSSKNNYGHLAAYGDRRFLLEFMLRAGVDLLQETPKGSTPFETALSNWCLRTIHFFLDISAKPLRTLVYLEDGKTHELYLLPLFSSKNFAEMQKTSQYIPWKIRILQKIHQIKTYLTENGKEGALMLSGIFSFAGSAYLQNYWESSEDQRGISLSKGTRRITSLPLVLLLVAISLNAFYFAGNANRFLYIFLLSTQILLLTIFQLCNISSETRHEELHSDTLELSKKENRGFKDRRS